MELNEEKRIMLRECFKKKKGSLFASNKNQDLEFKLFKRGQKIDVYLLKMRL